MAQIDTKDPKFILGTIAVLAGALGGGSMMGFTIEPKEMTDLRTEAALLRQQVDNLQMDVDECMKKHPELELPSRVPVEAASPKAKASPSEDAPKE
jgi:hypothetical protein